MKKRLFFEKSMHLQYNFSSSSFLGNCKYYMYSDINIKMFKDSCVDCIMYEGWPHAAGSDR